MQNSVKSIIKKIIRSNLILTICLFALMICVVGLSLLPPQILKIIIDDYLLKGNSKELVFVGVVYLSTFVLGGAFDFLKNLLLTIFGQNLVKEIRSDMNMKLSKLKTSYFTENTSGSITSKFLNDVGNISSLFTEGVASMIIDCFKILGIIVSLWIFNWRLGVFTMILVPAIFLYTAVFRRKILEAQKDNLKQLGKVNNHISETISNIIMIKTLNREKYMEDKYKTYLMENFKTNSKVSFLDSCYSPIIQVITAFSIALVLGLSIGENNILGITIGSVAASINYITNLFAPIDSLGMEIQSIQQGISGIVRVNEFLAEEEDTSKDYLFSEEDLSNGVSFSFDNMSFSYENGKEIFHQLNLSISKGEKVVFTGRTGIGKTTLFRLIVGNLKPTEGNVYINGIDAFRISNNQKRRIFGYVEQNFSFIEGNLWEQINLGDESISQKDIASAMEFVGLKSVVEELPNGFDTLVREDMFSQGQKQLMSIARAIVCNPPVLLLDEVTSGLDSVTEERVVSVLKKAEESKTILSIAHRKSTILSGGKIINIGGN